MSQESNIPSSSDPNDPNASTKAKQPAPRKRRRRWPWVILVLLLLVVGLVAMIPTIASTSPARSFVVGKINENLNGRVEIGGWSLGWFSPISVSDVRVYDDQNALILDIPTIKLGISIMDAAKQNFAFGNDNVVEVASFLVRVDEHGKTNLERLVKTQPGNATTTDSTTTTTSAEPSNKLPNVSGKFTVNIAQGTIESPNPPVHLSQSSAVVNITDINAPIEESLKLAYYIGDNRAATSTIETSGTIDAIENNEVQIDKLVVAQKSILQNVNLAAAEPFLKDMKVGGVLNGSLDTNAKGLTGVSANGNLVIDKFNVSGAVLNGDTFATDKITIPISVTRTVEQNQTTIKIEKLGAEMSQATIAVSGQVNEQALLNLSEQKAPGSDGTLSVKANVTDLANIANQLKNTIKLDPSVRIDSGKITNDIAVTLARDSVTAVVNVNADAKGQRNNQPIELKPIALSMDATALPNGKPIPNVRDLKLNLNSDFMTIIGGGESLAKIDIKGNFSLDKLRDQAAQFADLSKYQLKGSGDFAVNTSGEVTDPNAPIDASANVNLSNVTVAGVVEGQPINQEKLAIVATGKINRKDNAPTGVEKASFKLTSGEAASPLLAVQASADAIGLANSKVTATKAVFAIDTSNLKALQEQYGTFVPQLKEEQITVTDGGFHLKGAANYDGEKLDITEPIQMSIASLDVTKAGRAVLTNETIRATLNGSVTQAPDRIGAALTALSVTSQNGYINLAKAGDEPLVFNMVPSKNQFDGSGAVTIKSNVKSVVDLLQRYAPATQPNASQLRSGEFDGTIKLAKAERTTVDFTGQLAKLTVASAGTNVIDNEQLTFALNAVAPNDLEGNQPITASGKVGSSFVNVTLSDVRYLLSASSLLDQLQSATVDAQVPELQKVYALAQSFMPAPAAPVQTPTRTTRAPAARPEPAPVTGSERISSPTPRPAERPQPPGATPTGEQVLPPLEVLRGAALAKLSVNRNPANKTTTINVSDVSITDLSLRRGEQQFTAQQPVTVTLAAELVGDSPDKIQAIRVPQLTGNTEFASVQASQVVITDPLGPAPSYNADIASKGNIDNALALVSVLQGADKLPYAGDFDVSQKLATNNGQTVLTGSINVNKFRVMDTARREAVFMEDQIAIRNDATIDLAKEVAMIRSLTVEMPQSQALGVKTSAQLANWSSSRNISGLNESAAKLALTYDLEKLWPIVRPMLSPEMQEQYKALKIKGKYTREFTVSGAMPDVPSSSNVTMFSALNADGSFAVELLDLPQGITLSNFELPFTMKNGRVETKAAPESESRRATVTRNTRRPSTQPNTQVIAKTAVANEGALNLDRAVIELNKPDMPLSISRRQVLLNDVRLNPVLADNLGKLGGVIFTGASKANGLLTITVVECDHVPLGDLMKKTGKATFTIQLEELELDGRVPQVLAKAMNLGTEGIVGSIPPSTVTLANGVATTNLTVQIGRLVEDARGREVSQPVPLKFSGGLGLANLDLRNFMVDIPPALLIGDLKKLAPNGAVLPLTGSANQPNLDIAKFIQENAVRGIIGNITGGDANNRDNARPGEQPRNDNPIGNILEQLGGGGNDRNQPREREAQPRESAPRERQPAPRNQDAPRNQNPPRNQDNPRNSTPPR